METIKTKYLGNLRTQATHVRSGNRIITDAPVDNQGKGEAFSPTDLLAASLGSCMTTIMGIKADKNNINIEGAQLRITKIMAEKPRRVIEIIVEFDMPQKNYSEQEKEFLKEAAINCPVAKSLNPEIKQTVIFNY